MKNGSTIAEKVVAKVAYEAARKASNSACYYFFGQKKLPESVKKMRKF